MEVIWWTFFQLFFSFWGVLGKRTLNPEVLKCHEDRITLDTYVQQGKTMDNKFYIHVKTLTSLAKWGPGRGGGGGGGGFNILTGPILVHIYPPLNNNLHVKYRSNLIRTVWVKIKNMKKIKLNFFRGHVGPLHKIQGYQGHQNVSKRRPHHSGDICTTRGNNLKTIFSFMGQNVKKIYILGVFWGPWGGLQWSD